MKRPILRIALAALRLPWLLGAVLGFGIVAGGCSFGSSGSTATPQSDGPPGVCYFVVSSKECVNRHAQGVPEPVPPVWLSTYWPYYSSTSYSRYVPSSDDDELSKQLTTFSDQDQDLIDANESDGQWVDTDGNTWVGQESDDPADSSDGGGDDGGDGGGDDGGDDGGDGGGDD